MNSLSFWFICVVGSVTAVNWQIGNDGQIRWAINCDFNGGDIGSQKGRGEDCGQICLSRGDCTRFTWTKHEGGTCWLKNGNGQAFDSQNEGSCGEVIMRETSVSQGKSTRYWDCCKPSCGWNKKAALKTHPVNTCQRDGKNFIGSSAKSGCENGGTAFMCANQQPWAVNDNLAYGFAAAALSGQKESDWCCACYELTFTSGPVSGKKLVVQVTNTGGDLGQNHFDLQIPGGGVGIFNGCSAQYNAPNDGWGSRYGGVSNEGECNQLPGDLQAGCRFRFQWFKNADNPSHNFHRVKCPKEITDRTGCLRSDE